MRCASCGLPLSPTRTLSQCPRCGAQLDIPQKSDAQDSQLRVEQGVWRGSTGKRMSAGASPQDRTWAHEEQVGGQPSPGSFGTNSLPTRGFEGAQYIESGQMWPQSSSGQRNTTKPIGSPRGPRRKSSNAQFGFLIAGLCILLGGLLLVAIYVMALGYAGNEQTAHSGTGGVGTPHTTLTPRTPGSVTRTPTITTSPTTTVYPGQTYIDNVQMASAINLKTYKPTLPTTTFKINTRMYVTFDVHPAGGSGAVCLDWFLSNKQVTQYTFAISGGAHSSYSFATYGAAGPAYVELFWASTTQCSDQILAQRADFTVTL